MLDNMQIGLDVATAISVIGAAVAFIWNSTLSGKKEQKQRRKEIIHSYMMEVTGRMYEELKDLNKRIQIIEDLILQGQTTQDLNPYKNDIYDLKFTFRYTITPFDEAYGNGKFIALLQEYEEKIDDFMALLIRSTLQGSGEKFELDTPVVITNEFITKFMKSAETYINEL